MGKFDADGGGSCGWLLIRSLLYVYCSCFCVCIRHSGAFICLGEHGAQAGSVSEVWLWWILLFVVNWVTQEPGIDANESQDQELDAEKWEACISPHLVSRSLRAGEKCRQVNKMLPSFSFGKEDDNAAILFVWQRRWETLANPCQCDGAYFQLNWHGRTAYSLRNMLFSFTRRIQQRGNQL